MQQVITCCEMASRSGITPGCSGGNEQLHGFMAGAGESGGVAWNMTPAVFSTKADEWQDRQAHRKRPVRRRIARDLDRRWILTQNISLSVSVGDGGAGFLLHAQNYFFGQQPPKQPLAQNKNGSRFGCLASY